MEEEIDIIELLKRVKEGKAPKMIEIDNAYYEFYENYETIEEMYNEIEFDVLWHIDAMNLDTKIKILDKPIIEELDDTNNVDIFDLARKVNQIIKYINKEEK